MSIDKRIREGLHATDDELPTPDLGLALAAVTAGGPPARRRGLVVGLAAAAAAAAIAVVVGPNLIDKDDTAPAPAPSPTPTVTPLSADGSIYFAAEASAGEALTDVRSFGEIELHPQQMDIYLSRQGQPVRRVIATGAHERCPVVSPDGSHLAYLEGGTVVIVPLDADGNPGAAQVRVDLKADGLFDPGDYRPRNSAGPACPQWSPDGRRLGYQVTLDDQDPAVVDVTVTAQIHAVTLDGEDRMLASFDVKTWRAEPDFAWSPDGDAIAYTTLDGVWLARLDGSAPQLVWRTPAGHLQGALRMSYDGPISVAWSSKDELAFTVETFIPTEPNNPMSGGTGRFTVFVIDPGSGEVLFETDAGPVLEGGAGEGWSPDGSLLVFTGPDGHIRLHDRATGSTVRVRPQLEDSDGVRVQAPTWSPDGQQLLARAGDTDRGIALVSFAFDGSSSEVRTPWTWALDWASLDDVDWSSR